MSNSIYNDPSFNRIGYARLAYKYVTTGSVNTWREIGVVRNCGFSVRRTFADQRMAVEGKRLISQQRLLEETGELSFSLMEQINPVVAKLLFALGSTPVKNPSTIEVVIESRQLFGENMQKLLHPYNVQTVLPLPSAAAATLIVGAGTWPAATYSFAIVAWYAEDETNVFNAAWPTAACRVDGKVVALNDAIRITATKPTTGAPNHYSVYYQVGATFDPTAMATKVAEFSTSGNPDVVIVSPTGTVEPAFGAAAPAFPFIVTTEDGVTTFTLNTDYVVDFTEGTIHRVATGTLKEGETVVIRYAVLKSVSIQTDIGGGSSIPDYLELRVTQLSEGETGFEEGQILHFYRVNPQSGDISFPFSEDDFEKGSDVTWTCLSHPSYLKIGYKLDESAKFADVDTHY